MKARTSLIGLLVVCGIDVCSNGTAAVQPAAPPAGYNIEEKYTQKSPDGAITIEQYLKKDPEYHISANLLKGTEENYRGFGVNWRENRYLLIGVSGDADVKGRKPMQTGVVNGWSCRYDLQTGKFDVPPLFSNGNAKAVLPQ
jgi:hypothetical protein